MKTLNEITDWKEAINQVVLGDCLKGMKMMPENSVDLVVTSPPYDELRDYNGFSWDFEKTANELKRLLKEGGVIVWILGDQTVNGSETGSSFKQALYFKEIGFNLHDTMIYEKEKPPLTHNRYEQKFEYMFVFSNGKPKTFNPILIEKKYQDTRTSKHFSRNKDNSHTTGFSSDKEKVIKGNIWRFGAGLFKDVSERIKFKHPAVFPDKLAQDHIISWSNPNDIILDPFMGSWTTARACKDLGRNFIGFELSDKYCEIGEKRLEQGVLF